MLKYVMLLFLAILLLFVPVSVSYSQQNDTWSAYLLDTINYDLIRIEADGSSQSFTLDIGENEYVSEGDLSISHDGSIVAYCKTTLSPNNDGTSYKTLVIREITTGSIIYEVVYGALYGCSVTAFNQDDTEIALSIVHQFPMDANFNPDTLTWSLQRINLVDNTTNDILNNFDDYAPILDEFGRDVPLMARVRYFDDNTIIFAGIPYLPMGGPAIIPVYEWSFVDNTLIQLPENTGRVNNDFLVTTRDYVYPALDESLSAAQFDGNLPLANVVNILHADGTTETIYQNEDWAVLETIFINDGDAVAVRLLSAFDPENPTQQSVSRFDIVQQDGIITELDMTFDGGLWFDNIAEGMLIAYTPNPTQAGYVPTEIHVWDGEALTQVMTLTPDYTLGWSPLALVWTSQAVNTSV